MQTLLNKASFWCYFYFINKWVVHVFGCRTYNKRNNALNHVFNYEIIKLLSSGTIFSFWIFIRIYLNFNTFLFRKEKWNWVGMILIPSHGYEQPAHVYWLYTVSPNKHGNSVTIFQFSTFARLGRKLNILRGYVHAMLLYISLISPCLLGLTGA